jgi:hypothetical protein
MNLNDYINQENPTFQKVGSVSLTKDEVKVFKVGNWGVQVRVPRIDERFSQVGTNGLYFVKKLPSGDWGDRILWAVDDKGIPFKKSVFSLNFDPE